LYLTGRSAPYALQDYLPGAQYKEYSSLDGMFKMVQAGRLDGVVDYDTSLKAAQKKDKSLKSLVIQKDIFSVGTFFAFADNPKGKKLKEHFNKKIDEMIASGKMKAIMEKNLGSSENLPK